MTAFKTVEDLRESLTREGLAGSADAIVATARPCLLFLRRQAKDDPLPAGASKMGGFPDLPENFAWPERPPYPDAEKRAERVMAFAREAAAGQQKQVDGPLEPYQRRFTQAEVDAIVPRFEGKAKLFGVSFPLSFVAQLDLATLSREPGFDPELPKTGLLSVFEDTTAEGMANARVAYWHDVPAADLKRTPPPAALVEYYERHSSHGFGETEPWSKLTLAETLEPHSAVAVPHHWKYAFPQGSAGWTRVWDWFRSETAGAFTPSHEREEGAQLEAGYFGDRLGGWPDDIQGNPKSELEQGRRFVVTPGQTPWRHLFSYGGEFYGGTRLIGSDGKGDGATYLLIRKEDLAARRFEAVRWVYDQT